MKLLATDYDGTLKFGGSVLPADFDAIHRWRDAGNLFVIVTGRSMESISGETEEFKIPVDYYVTNNGGMAFDKDGNALLSSTLDTITAIDLMFASHEHPDVVSYVVNDGVKRYKVDVHPNLEDHRYPKLKQELPEEKVMDIGNFAQIVFSCVTPESAMDLADQINHFFGEIVVAYNNNFVVDVVPKGTSKATGLEFICAYVGADDDDIYAIGDSYNDIPMLSGVDHSAAVAAAPAEVQDNARQIVATVGEFIDDALTK
ncbi:MULTISPECIES: HAD-IIB family hydrolase [Allobaculum]|uniref:HAD-IIB family hydrolase n=1 Tax=Allobaculum TaxID=174708 RepID=UPI001E48E9DC|nr:MULTISPECIES: HAD-IIB family hydrolase [Allobaculum]UNT94014.1 HAD family hydrolase [Allobaculum sp. Allo2]